VPPLTPPDPPLSDGVVTLRPHAPEDRETVVAAFADRDIARWIRVPDPYGPADYDAFLARSRSELEAGRSLNLLIVAAGERVVGGVGLHEAHGERPDIGYWSAPHARGRGYVTRAVRLMRDHALALGYAHVDLLIHADNAQSQRVARAAGFERTGELTTCPRDACRGAEYLRFTWPPEG
jgi:RimJ/RimL family protein N-acetyltransferase